MRRRLLKIGVVLVVAWLLVSAALFVAMKQPPEQFTKIMAKVPWPAFVVLPFETLWLIARQGTLNLGDEAPDFRLQSLDKKSQVQLSSFRGSRPVVLVFGSYT